MEYRKNCSSPRDMVDDELLARLLKDSEPSCSQYGAVSQRRSGNSCGCRSRQMNMNPKTQISSPMPHHEQMTDTEVKTSHDCGCNKDEACAVQTVLTGYHLAMGYHPDHEWDHLYETEDALSHGTLFRKMDFPFYPACQSCR